jgi:CRISPR/Cas system-associated exonuclease Cas4 (RecB family)
MTMNLKQLLPYLPDDFTDLEKKVEGKIESYNFVGFVDILRDSEIIDLKFRKKYREPDTTQLNLYAKLLQRCESGRFITSSFLDGVLVEKIEYQDPTEFLLKIIERIERKEFYKKPSGLCNYCSFKEQCKEVKE